MLAGKYAARCFAWNNGSVLFPEHETLPAHLARNGYTTAAVGKMHFRGIVDDFRLLDFSPEEHRRALACYYACIDYVDDCIGALLEGMEREGLLNNTYIVYTSDHGDMAGEHGLWWKRTCYDRPKRRLTSCWANSISMENGRI